jgi:ribosomal-protein-alanine N-acetyltransferase
VDDPLLHPGWPARLTADAVRLEPLHRGDARDWVRLRLENEDWLSPWEPSAPLPWRQRHTPAAFRAMRRAGSRRARAGLSLPFAVRVDGQLAGQITVDNVVRGALRSGHLGYWIDRAVAGRGLATLAVALVCDHAFGPAGLHRLQADIRPENLRSQRLVERLGFRQEGVLRRYLDIDGDWRDHLSYALVAEDAPGGVLAGWQARAAGSL